jgi:GAF domain-containing protein/HAMP domain-containing protein
MTIDTKKTTPQPDPDEAGRIKNAYVIGLGTGILFLLIAIISTVVTIQTGVNTFGGIAQTLIIAGIGFSTAYFARHGRSTLGSAILLTGILLSALALPFIAKGQGIPLAVLVIVTASSIASYTLTNRWAVRVTVASVFIGALVILGDQLLPDFGIPSDARVTYAMSAIAGTIYTIAILRRLSTFPLRTKIVIAFVVITLIPIIILGVYNSSLTYKILTDQANDNLSRSAAEAASRIDTYISTQIDAVRTEAQQPILVNYLRLPEPNRAGALRTLLTFVRKDPIFIRSYALLDIQGNNLLDTDQNQIGQNESKYEYFSIPAKNGLPHISNLLFKSQYPAIYFAAPIRAADGSIVGVLRAEYDAGILQNIIQSTGIEQTGQSLLIVDRETLLRVATTSERDKIYHPMKSFLRDHDLILQIQQKLPAGTRANILAPYDDLVQAFDKIASQTSVTIPAETGSGKVVVSGAVVTTQPWVVAAIQAEKTIYAPGDEQSRDNIFLSLGLTAFAALAALIVAQFIIQPVTLLVTVAEKIMRGDLTARAHITTNDEVGRLSHALNDMTMQLNFTLTGLEERVATRTHELETANQKSNQRTRQLQSIADVSRIISREQSIEKLLPLVTDVVSERFGYYHIGIFLLDETRRFAVLQASNSPGGQKMVENGHRLLLGTSSIVGYAALTGKARIALDVGEDIVFFNNPNLPKTHSEMAQPLIVRGTTIGVLDMQSEQPAAFTDEDTNTLTVLADQIAIAIENARLFRQSQAALNETQSIVQSYLRQEWSAVAKRQASTGYLHSVAGGKVLAAPVKSDDIEQTLRKGIIVKQENTENTNTNPSLTVPIKLGEQVIGVIRIQSITRTHNWTTDEINLIRSIAERVGLALENARLISTSQRRASKERTIGEITTKISAATDMDAILQTAVQELGRILSGSEVVIQLQESQDD